MDRRYLYGAAILAVGVVGGGISYHYRREIATSVRRRFSPTPGSAIIPVALITIEVFGVTPGETDNDSGMFI
ncbi:MAG TPA: hypothetical protein VEC17_03350 [Candidatus Binatia bacterium]|nr:hypothetical protein [Candidatus Binatia bacterium]